MLLTENRKCRPLISHCIFRRLLSLFCAAILISIPAFGQDDPPEDIVPPPITVVSKEEVKLLEAENKVTNRTKLALELMETRLKKSESEAKIQAFEKTLEELGYFHALMNNTLGFLLNPEGKKPHFSNLKRFEKALKEFIPRLELVRRELPYRFGFHVRKLIKTVSDTREKSIEPFYGDTVIPNGV